ncbi:hypothetical protein C2G38_2224655 [Gigaspora rosea]|uniref:SWIM-type domain-containing protein n=1 Tax=Gigaspora rosea TaxID=44941 RepID=A0A397TZY2_9GLOM|nr:hypothetical protein C2G38_2224655 [Gigaspora rosea]
MYGQPTEICCQCLDFLQKGIMCKHLCAAAYYIDKLCQQEQHTYLPKIIFATHQKAQNICCNLCTNKPEILISHTNDNDNDDISNENSANSNEEDTDNKSNNQRILGIQYIPMTTLSASSPAQTQFRPNTPNENLKAFKNLVQFNQESKQISINNQYNLISHLRNIAISESFKNAQQLANIMYESINLQKHNASIASILPFKQEKKNGSSYFTKAIKKNS